LSGFTGLGSINDFGLGHYSDRLGFQEGFALSSGGFHAVAASGKGKALEELVQK
jgi:hypothetical protein